MALDFPASPSNGDNYVAPNGVTYVYDSVNGYWYVTPTGAVEAGDIADGAVTTPKIADGAVTSAKLDTNITLAGDLTANSLILPTAPVVGYQQGGWTPTVTVGTITNSRSNWTRIGNSVTVYSYIADFTGIGNETNIVVRGLPYPHSFSQAAGSCFYKNIKAGYDTTYVTDNDSLTSILFYTGTDADWSALKYSNISVGGSIYFMATYVTTDTTWTPINGATVS